MGLAAAVIGAGVVGAGASIATGVMNSNAVDKASKAQTAQDQAALRLQQQEFNTGQANIAPFLQAGQGALGGYQDLIGANGPDAQTKAMSGLTSNPLYLAATGAGDQAILANASATGGLRSGNTSYNLANLNAQTLAQVYQDQVGNLGSLVGLGASAAGGSASLGANFANSGAATLGNIGSAQAGGILGSSGALTGGINSGLGSAFNGISLAQMLGGFGGFGGGGGGYYMPNSPYTPGLGSSTLGVPANSDLVGLF